MAKAGAKVVECIHVLHQAGTSLVLEALRGADDFTEWEHYPATDVYDPRSHAQYYFHAHPPEERDQPDFGHFHTFMRPKGMPAHVRPAPVVDSSSAGAGNEALSHLVAISMSPTGLPERLFTTNRWVTGETWYPADAVISMLDRFAITIARPSRPLNEWITAMMVLFRSQVERLLIERDRAIDQWRAANRDAYVFEDRRLEITSSVEISIQEQLIELDRILS